MSKRLEAWRNLMVAAINAGLDQGVFSASTWSGRST
jgi:hypothetical protein